MKFAFPVFVFIALVACSTTDAAARPNYLLPTTSKTYVGCPRSCFCSRQEARRVCRAHSPSCNQLRRCSLFVVEESALAQRQGYRCQQQNFVGKGEKCNGKSTKCEAGLICSCGGICVREVTLDITVVVDDSLRLFTCGGRLIGEAPFDQIKKFHYTGGCTDLYAEVKNVHLSTYNPSALSMRIQVDGGLLFATAAQSPIMPLGVTHFFKPAADWIFGSPGFDYSTFRPTFKFTGQLSHAFHTFKHQGANPVSNVPTGSSAGGTHAYRIGGEWC